MLENFPGYLGYGGIIAIHAAWPNYPSGIGLEIALEALGAYPKGTEFYEIDDIDRCKLLITENPVNRKDYYDNKYYHTAIWHEDLVKLKKNEFITGVIEKSEFEFKLIEFENFKKMLGSNAIEDSEGNLILYFKNEAGEKQESIYNKPKPEEEEEEYIDRNCVYIHEKITLTEKGYSKLKELSQNIKLAEPISDLVEPLIKLNRYDTAIREASLFLETTLKAFHKTDLYGQNLVDYHIKDVTQNNNQNKSAAIKNYRGELRTIFKFIRNEFAHNFMILDEPQCRFLLKRINRTYYEYLEVIDAYYSKSKKQ
jgi:hypothetical protein